MFNDNEEQLESVIQQGLETTAPAIALHCLLDGETVFEGAYGVIDPETGAVLTKEARFDLASVTKLFTMTAFMRLVAADKVTIDSPVVAVIPEFGSSGPRPIGDKQDPHTLEMIAKPADLTNAGPVDPTTITYRHLLTHTSGLAPWRALYEQTGPVPPTPPESDPVTHAERLAKALALIGTYPFVDMPGRTVHYSDLGLILLGTAVARIAESANLAEAIEKLVLQAIGLSRTQYNPPNPALCVPTEFDARWRKRRIRGQVHDENAAGLGGIAGHAGLFGTAAEVARLGQMWLDALDAKQGALLPAGLAREAVGEHAVTGLERRGLGWNLRTSGVSSSGAHFSPDSFAHTGFTGTSLWVDPERKLVVALMTNRVYHGRDAAAIIRFRPQLHDAVVEYIETI